MPSSNKRMLYKYPGSHEIHGDFFDYVIVDDDEESIALAQSEGWYLTTPEAKEAVAPKPIDPKPLTAAQKKAAEKAGW